MTLPVEKIPARSAEYKDKLISSLSGDLDFHDGSSSDFTHDLHAFPAKFPPQLPRKFIEELTLPGEIVLDPMVGSGTTIVEAFIRGRYGVGVDIDPLALLICRVKTTRLSTGQVYQIGRRIVDKALASSASQTFSSEAARRFDSKTRDFINYWFHPDAQAELFALLVGIEQVEDENVRAFLELIFSSVIITKSGGVSLAFDLAHTRPHKVKDKPYRSPIKEFDKRLQRNLKSMGALPPTGIRPALCFGDAQKLPLRDNSVDLIVTSPPYASNAIDYMRAHKFSLVWLGHSIDTLSTRRKEYIGGEVTQSVLFEALPTQTQRVVDEVASRDSKKAQVLTRYYSEMTRALGEMFRVLKPDKAAIVVVGSSNMRGVDTLTHTCLVEIGQQIGFEAPHIGVRRLDRDRRMLPARRSRDNNSQIEKRMHEEYVIGFYKPSNR